MSVHLETDLHFIHFVQYCMYVHSSVGASYNFRFTEVCAFRDLFLIIARGISLRDFLIWMGCGKIGDSNKRRTSAILILFEKTEAFWTLYPN